MAAFTEEQIKILEGVFDHMWARMESLHDDINEDSVRLAALIDGLHKKGVLTHERVMAIVNILDMEAREQREPVKPGRLTENEITRKILRGETWEARP
jgi:hypothetical protein